jgi:hypothetical protein
MLVVLLQSTRQSSVPLPHMVTTLRYRLWPLIIICVGISLDAADAPGGGNSLLVQDSYVIPYIPTLLLTFSSPAPAFKSPLRHHQRNASHHRAVKETLNAHSEYTNNEEDGKAEHRINQYLIMDEIGRGSCGSVHLAIDQYGTEYVRMEAGVHGFIE